MRRWLSRRRLLALIAAGVTGGALRPERSAASHCHWDRVAGPYCSIDGRAYAYYCWECC